MTETRGGSKLTSMYRGEIKAGDHVLTFGDVTHVVGVINVSPESRNPHTVATTPEAALSLARRYRQWGADLIDVGGQSSHYENPTISESQEIERVTPVIEVLAANGFIVGIDTWKPRVAEAALEAGAAMVNDTGGLATAGMREVVAVGRAGVVAVHVDGAHPHDVDEVELSSRPSVRVAEAFREILDGLDEEVRSRIILDPGIAINYRGDYLAYTRMQLEVIRHSEALVELGRPILIPIPRKASIYWVTAYIALALEYEADLIRVHDVAVAAELVRLWGREVRK